MKVLITGGAGFIGSHVVDLLVADGAEVVVLDSLVPEVHGHLEFGFELLPYAQRHPRVTYVLGDVRNSKIVRLALHGCDAVAHLAAAVSVADSQCRPMAYVGPNVLGTAHLWERVAEYGGIKRFVVASSMSCYGETGHAPVAEDVALRPASVYGVTKRDQEELSLILGATRAIPTCALRFFNVYGPRQSLSNASTGVAAIFAQAVIEGRHPTVMEDGQQTRDFVYVTDAAKAVVAALHSEAVGPINICTGYPTTLLALAQGIVSRIDPQLAPTVTGDVRPGDIRHCIGDPARARSMLDWEAAIPLEAKGLDRLCGWAEETHHANRHG